MQIPSPTPVGCRPVIRAKWVKKASQEVPNAPVVTRVKRVLVTMGLVNHVGRVISVNPAIQTLLRAHHAKVAIIKLTRANHRVCRAFLARMKTIPVRPNAKIAALGNIKIHLAMIRV